MTVETFNYKEKFSFWVFTPAVVFIALSSYAFSQKVSFTYKGRSFLEYPYSFYIPGALAVLFILYAISKFIKATKSNQNKKPISLGESYMTFPKGSSDSITVNYSNVNELWVKDDNDDGESVILYTENNKNRYEFFAENFENDTKYVAFKVFLEQVCINITNRK
ncbi:hypothetical protein UMM65_11425 [Aureibaculum sp. 2210JD6-5]|uniref:hypothetical protein n=1 Tax=Aureibaculum sp. 2210JD6-5 TaxID=3103957 RepID=UPI002AAD1B06|nr:hypothetical protein [Aureibaculum sp. 2210JD6-5]MDY7395857.1 hypothetical protein [Aureibaculum sp. 2210JD6-5]